ncbi:MAG: formate dehydrogenase subunit gamma [Hyphomicrobiales bacterium]|nr:formate dehydrogenase subunit gamma [Hyphomicrobiales bacterium]MDE2115577.1 formate dehydrogenase subunit gamma [Hyphomicrobiales bacterium]
MGPKHDKLQLVADSKWDDAQALAVITEHSHLDGALLPILHALQETFGYVDARCVPVIAGILNVSKADVHGVISFYHDFRHAPAGRHVLKLCRAESCQAMGCESLVDHLASTHCLTMGETDATGALTVETVYCLGNCALSPAALLDNELIGRLDATKLDAIVMDATGMRS